VEKGTAPPDSQFVPRPASGDVVNQCTLTPATATGGPTVPHGPAGKRLRPRGLRVKVTPKRDRRAPYRFRTSGRLLPPAGLTAAQACGRGTISVQVKRGHRTISARRARLGKRCRFASRVRFSHARRLGSGRLRFIVRFSGNRLVSPGASRTVRARAVTRR
jgi:hypothetical protein